MKLRVAPLACAATLAALAQNLSAQPANPWRAFKQADGLAESACVSVTIGAGGHVLVRHPNSDFVSLLDGYDITLIPGPSANHNRVYESPGGQLWTVAPEGLQEFGGGEWVPHRVREIARQFQTGDTNPIPLLPVRQGRVLVLLREALLQFDVDDSGRGRAEILVRADQTPLGSFATMAPARDGGLWIGGAQGFAKIPGPLRNLKPNGDWTITGDAPPELVPPQAKNILTDGISGERVFDLAIEADGALWLATADGLFRRAPAIWETVSASAAPTANESSGLEKILHRTGESQDPEIAAVNWKTGLVARNGDAWLGGANAIAWRHKNAWRVFTSTNQLGPEEVLAFAEAPDGRIWCATPHKVWEFDGRNWLMLRGGFNQLHALCCARDGTLWLAAADGVHRYARGAWVQNDVADGLPSEIVTGIREDESGQILATTAGGVSVFQPEADADAPRTTIRPLADGEQKVREGAAIRLVFGGHDKWNMTTPGRLLFSHRLDEREWTPFQEAGEIVFADLPVGNHYFQVRAMDRNANIDPKPARLEFAVVGPWYRETRLVLVLTVALGVATFFAGLAFNRHRKLQRSYAEVERQVVARTRELELANRELIHSQKMNALGTLAAGIAHDFNNILSIVKGSAQIIEANPGDPEKIRTRVDRIMTVVRQGAEVVEAMLGFSRASDGPAIPCDLNAALDELLKLLGERFLREVEVRIERAERLPELSVSKDLVQQILLNFIFNAAESMRERKKIVLTTRVQPRLPAGLVLAPGRSGDCVLVSVQDFGSGIAPEVLPRIFEPFFTTKALSTRRGTGLGLSMVYELAKKMGAGLAVESTAGRGSTFTLILPLTEPAAGAASAATPELKAL